MDVLPRRREHQRGKKGRRLSQAPARALTGFPNPVGVNVSRARLSDIGSDDPGAGRQKPTSRSAEEARAGWRCRCPSSDQLFAELGPAESIAPVRSAHRGWGRLPWHSVLLTLEIVAAFRSGWGLSSYDLSEIDRS